MPTASGFLIRCLAAKEKPIDTKRKKKSRNDVRLTPHVPPPPDRLCRPRFVWLVLHSSAKETAFASLRMERDGAQALSVLKNLARAQGLITTWDSPQFSEELVRLAPDLRIIAHCGGEVKRRFARPLFESLTITTGPVPMARATAEMGASLLLYCARNVDFYREQLRGRSNRIYQDLHLHGSSESIIGQEVAMIGFGRIGRALVDLLRGFDLQWLVYDPYVSKSLARKYPVRLMGLPN